MTRWLAWTPLAVLALVAALMLGYGLRHDPHVDPAALVGKVAPPVAIPPLDGGPARTPQEPGRVVLVNFFASTCVPCAVEAPALAALQTQGARLVGVSYRDDAPSTRRFLQRWGDPFTAVLTDASGRAAVDWGVSAVPETFAVGPDGRVLAKHSGALEPRDAERLMEAAARAERSASTPG